MTLFENICLDLLLEGKTPEEILAALKYKFKDVPEEVILKLFEMDTTKKKSYTQWVLSHWAEEGAEIEQLIVSGKMKEVFDFIKETHDIQIQGYKSVKELVEDLKYKMSSGLDLLEKNGTGSENDFTILYNSPEWVVVTPNTYEASHKLGVGTSWCTAGWRYNNGKYYYDRYLNDYGGKYYINFDKRGGEKDCAGVERPYKRYQFHFESNQFMNILDRPISLVSINMPEDVIEFYEKVEPVKMEKLVNSAKHEKRKQAYLAARREYAIHVSGDYSILPKYDDTLNPENLPNIREFGLYDMEYDEVDPISLDYFNKNILFYGEINNYFVLIVNTNVDDTTDYGGNLKTYFKGEYPCNPTFYVSRGDGPFGRWYGFDRCDNAFYSVLENNLFVITGDRVCDLLTNIENPFDDEATPQKAFLNCEIDGKQYFEVVWENGFHSLYCSNTNFSNAFSRDYSHRERFYPIISLDLPPEGKEKFEVTMNSAKGKLIHNYDISPNNNNFKIIKQLYDNFYVATTLKDSNYRMVYDITEQCECFFTNNAGSSQVRDFDWITKIPDRPFFIGSLGSYSFLFSLPLRKMASAVLYEYEIDYEEGKVYDYDNNKVTILHDNGEYEIKDWNEDEGEGEEMTSKAISENFSRFLKRINDVKF